MPGSPEQQARRNIDRQLDQCGWIVQDHDDMNISTGLGVAIREFPLTTGSVDYMLYADGKAIGIVEAKPEGHTLTGVEVQSETRLHQAILKRAFEGRLVPQDPNDEPASVLLERIAAELKTAVAKTKTPKKTRKKKRNRQ